MIPTTNNDTTTKKTPTSLTDKKKQELRNRGNKQTQYVGRS